MSGAPAWPVTAQWNFGDLLDATAAAVPPGRPALIHGTRVIDWASFDARTNSLARAMLAGGLTTGDRVAVPNRTALFAKRVSAPRIEGQRPSAIGAEPPARLLS